MRITGLATGLDMDEIIKNSMKPYRIKVDQMTQKKDVVEIKQKLYRDVIKDNRDFFNKHLDIAKSDSLLKASNWASVSFSSSDENAVTAKASGGAIKDNYTVSVEQLASKASTTLKDGATVPSTGKQILETSAGKVEFEVVTGKTLKENAEATIAKFNEAIEKFKNDNSGLTSEQLKSLNITAKYSEISKGIVFEAKDFGQDGFTVTNSTGAAVDTQLKATITNSKGEPYNVINVKGNTVTVDGVTFNFNEVTKTFKKNPDGTLEIDTVTKNPIVESDKPVKLTGKTDAKELKDKIVAFVNDYNKLIEKMNTTVSIKHDRSYNPLTADQKKDMSETEVKLWNERVEKGQLYKDSDVTRIANDMKDSMRTLMEGSGLKLEKIGIKPVKDYSGDLNGTFTIDEDVLKTALENNTEDVMNLFITPSPTEEELAGLSSKEITKRKNQTGILFKLKDTIDVEFRKSTSSPLLKKAGFEGTSTFSTNELSKNITNYEKKIKDMEKSFSRREQALYSKYATLEKMMNKLNSQQSNLMSQLGMN
ncbi:flagellar filament capping protein FliD [Clostridium aquiflavi]|uniref:Flagellar hook-associated protein 2 n=1 Tax=Clostridium aquiflavi TaxID=3073603 RepID=A0ABU1EDU1_9CLOT|nr:flagellar filament capping protein FliD [Clostridium sp. 5N-1]MDR5586535.1 flagellar filament capping protein FliD [Clostridium sp. 5N-1]